MRSMKEEDYYLPVKRYLEGQGYSVHPEVKNCDVVARKNGELVIVELKKNLSMRLLIQAAKRKELTESVYIAVPVEGNKGYPGSDPGIKLLLRRLEIGLIIIRVLATKMKLEVVFHPLPFSARKSNRKKRALIREIDGRYAEFNAAGEAAKKDKITAYKQESLRIAELLSEHGTMSPKNLRDLGCSEKTQIILSKNVYGWFERVERGVYALHPAGREALANYASVVEKITRKVRRNA